MEVYIGFSWVHILENIIGILLLSYMLIYQEKIGLIPFLKMFGFVGITSTLINLFIQFQIMNVERYAGLSHIVAGMISFYLLKVLLSSKKDYILITASALYLAYILYPAISPRYHAATMHMSGNYRESWEAHLVGLLVGAMYFCWDFREIKKKRRATRGNHGQN